MPVWQDRTIASGKLRMLEYSAFMEVQRDPDTVSERFAENIGDTGQDDGIAHSINTKMQWNVEKELKRYIYSN